MFFDFVRSKNCWAPNKQGDESSRRSHQLAREHRVVFAIAVNALDYFDGI